MIAAAEFGAALGKNRFVAVGLLEGRLKSGGPKFAAVQITQVTEGAPMVAGGVFPPASEG